MAVVALRPVFAAAGVVVADRWTCWYTIRCDASGATRACDVHAIGGRMLRLRADAHARWQIDGRRATALDGCRDVDLTCTPLTNTLPIRRLAVRRDRSAVIRVAWIAVPSLRVVVSEQRYTRLDGGRWRFALEDGSFRRVITVDRDGLVLAYPGLFRRTTTQHRGHARER